MVTGSIGERIAAYRKRRGLSQAALAGLVGRSESWLSQVERGIRSVDRMSVILDLSRVLHVEPDSLTGRPWMYAPNGGSAPDELADVRAFFTSYEDLLVGAPSEQVALPSIRADIALAHRTYQATRYDEAVGMMPSLLRSVEVAHRGVPLQEQGEATIGYVSAYVAAAKLLTKVGATDLAMLAADRAATKAIESDSDVARGMAVYQVTCALLRADRSDDAEHIAVGMAEQLTVIKRSDRPSLLSLAGALWLIAAVVAARKTDRGEAWRRLDEAEALAGLLGEDANHAWTAFGPTNVALHRVSVAAELGDVGEALRAAASVDPARFPEGLTSRRAQLHLDLAWAQVQRKRDAEATLHLIDAERIAPEAVRYNVLVRELLREMLHRAGRSQHRTLVDLAVRSGVID